MAWLQLRAAGQNIAESSARSHAERLVNARPAHVGVDEQYAAPFCASTIAVLMLVVVLPSWEARWL